MGSRAIKWGASRKASLMGIFLLGSLNESLKDDLAARDESESLAELIDLARRLDNRMRERRWEHDRSRVTSSFIPFSAAASDQRVAIPTPEEVHAPAVLAAL